MGSAAIVILVLVVGVFVYRAVSARRVGLVPRRGLGIGADLAAMGDRAVVTIRGLTDVGPGLVEVAFAAAPGEPDSDDDVVVVIDDDAFVRDVLERWHQTLDRLAIVRPPGGRLVRLRSLGDLQHITLRVAPGGPPGP